jgi:hypothetical protein
MEWSGVGVGMELEILNFSDYSREYDKINYDQLNADENKTVQYLQILH